MYWQELAKLQFVEKLMQVPELNLNLDVIALFNWT
jgi:hypothetical protein